MCIGGGRTAGRVGKKIREKFLSSRISEMVDRLDKLELEFSKLSQDIISLKEETQQRIQSVNVKFSGLINGVYESLGLQISETKQHHTEISTKLHDNKKELDSKINNMQLEIVNLRQELFVESFCVLGEKLGKKINELHDRRLGQFEDHLD
jgi:hypothetical protein